MSSSAPIVPTKVLGDPEELDRHLSMHQNGAFAVAAEPFVAVAAVATEAGVAVIPSLDSRFIFAPPTLELAHSDVQLHVITSKFNSAIFLSKNFLTKQVSPNVPHQAAVIHLTGSHLGATTTEGEFEAPVISVAAPTLPAAPTAAVATIAATSATAQPLQVAIGQPLELLAETSDYSPEVENFDVVLKKDSQGLGITIAGYVCEKGTCALSTT